MAVTHWILKQETTDVMIPSLEYGKPCDNLEAAKHSPIRHLIDIEVVTDRLMGASQTVSPPCRPSCLAITTGAIPHRLIANQALSQLVDASSYNKDAKNATFTTSMTLTPTNKKQRYVIFVNAGLQMDKHQVHPLSLLPPKS